MNIYKLFVLVCLSVSLVLGMSACNNVKVVLPNNGCNVTACTNNPNSGGIYVDGKDITK